MKTKNKRPSSKILEAATDYSKAPLIVAPNTINSIRTTNGPATNYYPENEDTMEESDLEELEINLSPSTKVKESPIEIGRSVHFSWIKVGKIAE